MPNFTKRAIQASFVKLLNQKTLDKISVKDVVEDCGINRNTFYYHYQDIYDLLRDILETEISSGVDGINETNWREGFAKAIDFALKNKKAVYHIYNSQRRDLLENYLYEKSSAFTEKFVQQEARGLNVSRTDIEYVTVFYKHAFMGIVTEWLKRDMNVEPMEAIEHFGYIFEGELRRILEKISSDNNSHKNQ